MATKGIELAAYFLKKMVASDNACRKCTLPKQATFGQMWTYGKG